VALATAALAFSLLDPGVSVTVIGASTPDKLRQRAAAFAAPLGPDDFREMIAAAGGSYRYDWGEVESRPYNDASFE
jgi:aryl-alcohol dehydrogenase-like predicted oxidoreductase